MKLLNKTLLSTAADLTVLFSGCGESASDTTSSGAAADDNIVTVERGPVLGAMVMDAQKHQAKDLGDGRYEFNASINYPVEVVGGYIDVNRNGTIDSGEVKNTVVLKADSGKAITLVSTLARDKEARQLMEDNFGLTLKDMQTKVPSDNIAVEALSNEIYAMMIDQGIEDVSKLKLKIKDKVLEIKTKINEYESDDRTVAEREEELVLNLQHAPVISDLEVEGIELKLKERSEGVDNDVLNYINDINLSAEQETALKNAYILQAITADLLADSSLDDVTKASIADKMEEGTTKFETLLARLEVEVPTDLTDYSDFSNATTMEAEIAALKLTLATSADNEAVYSAIEAYLRTKYEEIIAVLPEMMRISMEHDDAEMKMDMEMQMHHDGSFDDVEEAEDTTPDDTMDMNMTNSMS